MRKSGIILVAAVVFSSGCATHKAAPKAKIERQNVYQVPFEKAWNISVDFFAENGINLDKIEKDSGLLTAQNGSVGLGSYLNCGEAGGLGSRFEDVNSRLNVLVRKVDDETSKISVNLNANAYVVRRNLYGHALERISVRCESTGQLENDMHAYFQSKI
ncbi:hypothetical protein H9C73_15330 [Marinobacterium sp. AK62]|uniref:Lipoprotein n=1 Tax=Marinobacterium alkalitolerans TaxID=1542925 RepID=A0ABS3ZFL3_9GAMM|nr:hypothetical protein [Marinobacterium alkalitolerans]MBP0050098.1 hypothetical protein [Marinobacterium alkalitolerans]